MPVESGVCSVKGLRFSTTVLIYRGWSYFTLCQIWSWRENRVVLDAISDSF